MALVSPMEEKSEPEQPQEEQRLNLKWSQNSTLNMSCIIGNESDPFFMYLRIATNIPRKTNLKF
jgi:hypothetical protein